MTIPSGLHGRDYEWGRILAALDATEAGHGALLVIEGAPGMGKTRLLVEAVHAATKRDFLVATNLTPTECPRFVKNPAQKLEKSFNELAASHGPGFPNLRFLLSVRLRRHTNETASGHPMLIALDDAHCLDPVSLRELSTLSQKMSNCPPVWVVTHRSGTEIALSRMFRNRGDATQVKLRSLSEDAVACLVADMLGAKPHPDLLAALTVANGNPLLVRELVEDLREDGALEYDHDGVRLASEGLPQQALTVMERRLRGLTPKCRHLLQVASALGCVFALDDVARMLRETSATLLPVLEEALAAEVIVSTADHLAFAHEVVWQAVAHTLPPSVQHALRREAELVSAHREHPVAPTSPHTAAGALPVLTPAHTIDSMRPPFVVRLVDARLAAGQLTSAAVLARDTLAQPVPAALAAELWGRLANVLIMQGRSPEAAAAAERVLAATGPRDDLRDDAQAAWVFALSLHDQARARKEAQAILAAGEGRDAAAVIALTVLANLAWDDGDVTEGLRLARQAVDRIHSATPPAWRLHSELAFARKLANLREIDKATEIIRASRDEGNSSCPAFHAAASSIAMARVLMLAGRLTEAREEATQVLTAARELDARLLVPLTLSVLAAVALRTGDLLTAAEHVERCRTELTAGCTPLWSVQYEWVKLLLVAEQDGPRRAAEMLTDEHAGLLTRKALFIEEPGAAAWFVRLALVVGDHKLAETVVATMNQLAQANAEFPSVVTAAVHAHGLLEHDAEALERAAAEHREPWARAWAAEDLGVQLANAGQGRDDAAVRYLEAALQGFEEIGAERDVARVRNHLRKLGVRPRRTSLLKREPAGWESLGETERTIAHLVSQGLTNRQIAKRVFLSPHTVNYHLRQIFRKLGINSRVELARLTQDYSRQHALACTTPNSAEFGATSQ